MKTINKFDLFNDVQLLQIGKKAFFEALKKLEIAAYNKGYNEGMRKGTLSGYNSGRRDGKDCIRDNY